MQKKRRIREGNGNCFVVVFFVYKDVSYEGNANTLHTDLFSWQKKTMKSWTPIPQIIACTLALDSIAEPIEQGTAICTIVC